MDSYERVHESLISLGMDTIEHTIDNYLENARDKSIMEILDHLFGEVKSKLSKRYETKLKYAGFPFRKPWRSSISRSRNPYTGQP